ncbi:hypothetical protein KOR42_36420 [Thalassoglobus neptunius]|uniref:Uncharacterized protein n=1 Tax=Thalassoglobus neptunius TaxID=1938619 RepID=A0A5C5WH32_9PLAN|nr:hypothetical protein KOR42_36420 [Thalassoglobus neptunius]
MNYLLSLFDVVAKRIVFQCRLDFIQNAGFVRFPGPWRLAFLNRISRAVLIGSGGNWAVDCLSRTSVSSRHTGMVLVEFCVVEDVM